MEIFILKIIKILYKDRWSLVKKKNRFVKIKNFHELRKISKSLNTRCVYQEFCDRLYTESNSIDKKMKSREGSSKGYEESITSMQYTTA